MKRPKFNNFGEYFFWSYANWMMYCAAVKEGATSYKNAGQRNYYTVRTSWYKKLKDGKANVHDLLDNNVWKIDAGNDCCWYCGKKVAEGKLTKEHVLPLIKGGEDTFDNIAMACKECNSSKGDKDFMEWYTDKFNRLPSDFMIGIYMKLVYKHAVSHALMDKHYDEMKDMLLPFNPLTLPTIDIQL